MEHFKEVFLNGFTSPKCDPGSSSLLYGYSWMSGVESERTEPHKIIHGRDGVVLVRQDYKCFKKQHEVVSYHPGILRQMNAPSLIPFRLLSRTGTIQTQSAIYEQTELVQVYTLAGLCGLKFATSLLHCFYFLGSGALVVLSPIPPVKTEFLLTVQDQSL